jgi:hypothetical protein
VVLKPTITLCAESPVEKTGGETEEIVIVKLVVELPIES